MLLSGIQQLAAASWIESYAYLPLKAFGMTDRKICDKVKITDAGKTFKDSKKVRNVCYIGKDGNISICGSALGFCSKPVAHDPDHNRQQQEHPADKQL
jgi:hypothetical protein